MPAHGTWQVTGGGRGGAAVRAGAGAVAAAAVLSWLAAVLWIIAIAAGVLLAVAVAGVIVLRRRDPEDAEAFARQCAALNAAAAPKAVPPAPPVPVVHFHGGTHLHITPGGDGAAIIRKALEGAVTTEEE